MREREILSRMQMRDLSSRRVETVLPELRRTRIFWLNNNKANFKNRQLERRGRGGGGGAMLFPGLEFEFCLFHLQCPPSPSSTAIHCIKEKGGGNICKMKWHQGRGRGEADCCCSCYSRAFY